MDEESAGNHQLIDEESTGIMFISSGIASSKNEESTGGMGFCRKLPALGRF
jgi:hypothetical protein